MTLTIGKSGIRTRTASVQVSPTVGFGCITLFLLPFAAVGVFATIQALRRISAGNWREALFFGLFAVVFGGVGLGGLALVQVGRQKQKAEKALKSKYPEQPWRWREDWASGRVDDAARGTVWSTWFFAALWNLIGFPTGFLSARAAIQQNKPLAYLGLLFPLAGILLLTWAIRATVRYRKFGSSRLQLSTIPGVIGHTIGGTVWIPTVIHPTEKFQLTLSCVRRVTTGSDDHTSESVLWQDQRTARGEPSRDVAGLGTRVPVAFRIPGDARACDRSDPKDSIVWRLQVEGGVPGVDYSSVFDVPVFRTAASDSPLTVEEERTTADVIPTADYRQPVGSRIRVSINARGTEVSFPAARNLGAALGGSAFTVLWLVVVWALVHFKAPILFPIVFGAFGVLSLYGTLELWLGVSQVSASPEALTVATGYLSPGKERRVASREIADVSIAIGMQAGTTVYYDVMVRRMDGKKLAAGRAVRDKREAEWLAATIKSALRLSPLPTPEPDR